MQQRLLNLGYAAAVYFLDATKIIVVYLLFDSWEGDMAGYCTLVLYIRSLMARENTATHSCNIQPVDIHSDTYLLICDWVLISIHWEEVFLQRHQGLLAQLVSWLRVWYTLYHSTLQKQGMEGCWNPVRVNLMHIIITHPTGCSNNSVGHKVEG